jgi:hypothetical protein
MITRLAVTAMVILCGCPVIAHGQDTAAAEATAAAISYLREHQFADDVPVSFNVRGDSRLEGDIARGVASAQPRARQDAIRCVGSARTCRMAPGILAHYDVIDARPEAAGVMVVQLVSNRITENERQPLYSLGWRIVLHRSGPTTGWKVESAAVMWES